MTTATIPATTTSPTGNAVLVLGERNDKPFIVDFNGKYHLFSRVVALHSDCQSLVSPGSTLFSGNINEDLTFEYGDGEAHYGCAATLRNEFWYFGGSSNIKLNRQVKWQKYLLDIYLFYFRLVK